MQDARTDYDRAKLLIAAVQELSGAQSVADIQDIVQRAARRIAGADGATVVRREAGRCVYADEDAIAPTFVKSMLTVSMRQSDPIGAIGVYWARLHTPTAEDIELLQALADSTAVALQHARSVAALEQSRLETLQRLALAGEYRDDDTSQHTQRVSHTAALIAERLGLPEREVALMRQAASLHDIGKLSVPDAILLKPGRLSYEEFEQVKGHAEAGWKILEGSHSEALRLAAEIALTHHEKWDGSGYPEGRAQDEIPLSGRIVAVADVFDSLTHQRPYKHAWPLGEAVAEVESLRGRQFDPAAVDAFRSLDAGLLIDGPKLAVTARPL